MRLCQRIYGLLNRPILGIQNDRSWNNGAVNTGKVIEQRVCVEQISTYIDVNIIKEDTWFVKLRYKDFVLVLTFSSMSLFLWSENVQYVVILWMLLAHLNEFSGDCLSAFCWLVLLLNIFENWHRIPWHSGALP